MSEHWQLTHLRFNLACNSDVNLFRLHFGDLGCFDALAMVTDEYADTRRRNVPSITVGATL
ncbi:hypothetical protein [Mesorhizobium sp.]|uniref:hypothetical protein n=1 Tax=Mesorhizobium sp. TaxID=1871066 RepID=UPI000FE9400F|nr:hypothetical protein [Mesorhizobium sp.]RWP24037.1 MAG: hypothetical protein EOR02_31710 [Mesorhizobium sp.]